MFICVVLIFMLIPKSKKIKKMTHMRKIFSGKNKFNALKYHKLMLNKIGQVTTR